ncbi:hypothetical protein KRX57_07150 [Weeksellaceae bacterium TAE3-ERU29]|nr:hypothetical protein [Weeksellaceae bacterium TAE3-ERU29]
MKKQIYKLSTVFFLGLGAMVSAQVGINELEPKATLDINVKQENKGNEHLEGLLIPRVTKEKAFKMTQNATKALQESTLIYVNDFTYTSSDTEVEDITEKGFYFWNGTKWVKSNGIDGQEWVYDSSKGQINLRRSGQSNFKNKVFYTKEGGFKSIDFDGYTSLLGVEENQSNYYSADFKKSSNILSVWTDPFGKGDYKTNLRSIFLVDGDEAKKDFLVNNYAIGSIIDKNYTGSITDISGFKGYVRLDGAIDIKHSKGIESYNLLNAGNVLERMSGIFSSNHVVSNGNANKVNAVYGYNTIKSEGGTINSLDIFSGVTSYQKSKNITESTGVNVGHFLESDIANITIDKLYGFKYRGIKGSLTNHTIADHYGIYLDDIDKATNNYAIYANAGKVRFGDLANASATANRVVTVNNDGVLSTQGVTDFANSNNEWVYDSVSERINLKRSGQEDFKNKVFYTKNGGLKSYDFEQYTNIIGRTSDISATYRGDFKRTSNIPNEYFHSYYTNNYYKDYINTLLIADEDNPDRLITGATHSLLSDKAKSTNYHHLVQSIFSTEHEGSGDAKYIIGGSFFSRLRNGKSTGYISALRASGIVEEQAGFIEKLNSFEGVTIVRNNASIELLEGLSSKITFDGATGAQVAKSTGVNVGYNFLMNTDAHIKKLIGFQYSGVLSNANQTYDEHYGLLINDVIKGNSNYAIYTNKGINSFGDKVVIRKSGDGEDLLKFETERPWAFKSVGTGENTVLTLQSDIADKKFKIVNLNGEAVAVFRAGQDMAGNRVGIGVDDPTEKLEVNGKIKTSSLAGPDTRMVVANEDGVLSTQTIPSNLSAKWVEDPSNNTVNLTVNSEGNPRTSNIVSIDDNGKVLATAFRGTNGATIFPDYVFDNYYTGTSTTKADYSFKNLNQVEDYVKANGHLPGYVSAKEIKAQGYIDIMDTQLTNVEKIEELYLHTIEQEKALKAKDAKIEKLEAELENQKSRLDRLEQLLK